ncbi:MAG: ComF family protein [Parvibaculaceae bacterium]|nr:ComF family protein [Parvibaculaceae bacterium]
MAGEIHIGVWRRFTGLAAVLREVLLPPLCPGCGEAAGRQGTLCPACWAKAHWIEAPLCPVTGLPFSYDPGPGALSALAIASPPPYAAARAVLAYGDLAARLVSRLKYGDRMEIAEAFAPWMVRAGGDVLKGADLLVPVPLHRWRLFRRRFNQSAELARGIGKLSGLPCRTSLLHRIRATEAQVGLTRNQRQRNVQGAFAVDPRKKPEMAGKTIVLVDDVMTTGATVDACTRALLRAGAAEVRVLTLARVVPGETAII